MTGGGLEPEEACSPPSCFPGEAFLDGGGRLRRACAHCGSVIPYATHGSRRYCTARCCNAAATKRRHADPKKLEADRRSSRDANRRAYRTAEGRERILEANRRYRLRKKAGAKRA